MEKPPSVEVPTTAKMPRYLAVPVEPDERKQGAEQIIIWDTQSSNFIDNSVYDVAETPKEGVEMNGRPVPRRSPLPTSAKNGPRAPQARNKDRLAHDADKQGFFLRATNLEQKVLDIIVLL